MRECEQKISVLKNERFQDLTKPVEAFITFVAEDGSIVGQYFEPEYTLSGKRKPAKGTFMGQDLFLRESTEPTNIIWENMHWTSRDYLKRSAIVFTAIGFLIAISFAFMFWFKSYSIQLFAKYPQVDCTIVEQDYYSQANHSYYQLRDYAHQEYNGYYGRINEGKQPTPF